MSADTVSSPSVIIPLERNLLINPQHADMFPLQAVHEAPFRFDPRLLRAAA
jgi:RES domain-containing protein